MRIIIPGATRKNVFKEVARLRNQDAEVLFDEEHLLGSVYLLGYSIECYLKYTVCERNGWNRLPEKVQIPGYVKEKDLYTHDWPVLVEVAGISRSIREQKEIDAIYSALCEQWGPELRYRTKPFSDQEGTDLYKDLAQLYQFLKEIVP